MGEAPDGRRLGSEGGRGAPRYEYVFRGRVFRSQHVAITVKKPLKCYIVLTWLPPPPDYSISHIPPPTSLYFTSLDRLLGSTYRFHQAEGKRTSFSESR